MNFDITVWQLVMGASPLVQGVMLCLLMASVMSWTYIFQRFTWYRHESIQLTLLENLLRREDDSRAVINKADSFIKTTGIGYVVREGMNLRARLKTLSPSARHARLNRCMQGALLREVSGLQRHLPFLATVSSVSPYIGLFGTVWGIMNALRALGATHQATLSQVAPGMAEALIATAMGLFAAIPAAIAYNRYAYRVQELTERYDAVADHFMDILMTSEAEHD